MRILNVLPKLVSHVHLKLVRMPPKRVNVNRVNESTNPSKGDRTSTALEQPRRANILEDSVEPLVQAMIEAFQQAASANTIFASRGFPLKRLRALGGKEFNGAREPDPTKVEY